LHKYFWGLSPAALLSALVAAIRSTPQPPYRPSSFAWQIICGGFAGYLLLSPIPSAGETLLGFYPHNRKIARLYWRKFYKAKNLVHFYKNY
jgi:hypothetical protein